MLKTSRYLDAFKAMDEQCKDSFTLYGDAILVEEIPDEELKSKGGIIIATSSNHRLTDGVEANKPTFVRVLQVGAGFEKDEGELVPVDANPGDIILVGKLSVMWFSAFGNILTHNGSGRLGLTIESEIKMRFKGHEGYEKVFKCLNEELSRESAA